MKISIDIDEDEILEKAKELIIHDIANRMMNSYSSDRYCYRKVIKECVREVIKSDMDNLAERAVNAASVSITNKAVKKVTTEELLARLAGRDGE